MTLKLTDQKVRRVLECLADFVRRSGSEVAVVYNRRYPPSRFLPLLRMTESTTTKILEFLVSQGFVKSELLSFTNETIHTPVHFYGITSAGIQFLSGKRR